LIIDRQATFPAELRAGGNPPVPLPRRESRADGRGARRETVAAMANRNLHANHHP